MNSAKTGRLALLAALNAAAKEGVTFLASDLEFATPVASTNPNRDTEVTYTAVADSQFEGSAVAFYDRLDLTAWFAAAGVSAIEVVKPFATVGELVEKLNTRFDLGFTEEDFDFTVAIAEGDSEVVLEALPGSFAFKGELIVALKDAKTPLADTAESAELGGLAIEIVDAEAPAPVA